MTATAQRGPVEEWFERRHMDIATDAKSDVMAFAKEQDDIRAELIAAGSALADVVRALMPERADHAPVAEYDAKQNPWLQCSHVEGGHQEGECPQELDDDDEIAGIPFGEIKAASDTWQTALAKAGA